jgi:hypothetical protein
MRPPEGNMSETQGFVTVFTKLRRIAVLARENPQLAFTSLNHCLDLELLREAFHKTRKDGAPGVDGQTWHDYEANLEANLQALLERAKSGSYQAPPVRRVYIPKGGSPTEKPLRQRYSEAARRYAEVHYDAERAALAYERALAEALARPERVAAGASP